MRMTTTGDAARLCQQFLHLVNRYGQMERMTHTYDGETILHLSEVHTIADIGVQSGINISRLAEKQGVSRSAASQMISKLVKKGFVEKKVSPETDNEVVLQLTAAGEAVQRQHEAKHQWLENRLAGLLSAYPPEILQILGDLAEEVEKLWEEIPSLD